MKKLACMALALLGALSASAQHYVGAKLGYGGAHGRIFTRYGAPESALLWNKYSGGVAWKYYSPQQVVGGVSVELEYQQRGYRIFDNGHPDGISVVISDDTEYTARTRTVNTLTMPLIWQPHLYMINRRVRIFLNAGITLSYNLGMGDTFTVTEYTVTNERVEIAPGEFENRPVQVAASQTTPYAMQRARDVRWNYGWLGGFGIGVLFDRWEVFAEGRYYYGMSDILRNKNKFQFHGPGEPLRSELDNITISVGVFFRLGKGDITEPPLRKRVATPAGENDFRNIKLNM